MVPGPDIHEFGAPARVELLVEEARRHARHEPRRRRARAPRALVLSLLAAVTLVGWSASFAEMRGMDAGPGTDLGTFGWFIGVWLLMTVAMMLPSATPVTLLVARLRRVADACVFVAGYLVAWLAYGVVAYAVYRGVRLSAPAFVAWDMRGPWVAGCALAVAGLYQLTPLKTRCLRHCRSPIGLLVRAPVGTAGAFRIGVAHGAYCIGCCAGLMLALFALGVMSLVWMAAATVAILLEKTMPGGPRAATALAVLLVGLGIWVAVAPGAVPGLKQPHPMEMARP
jgi:predicted metal-binding membrane protein